MKILVKPEGLNNIQAGRYEALCELGSCGVNICGGPQKGAMDEENYSILF